MILRRKIFEIIRIADNKSRVGQLYDVFLVSVVILSLIPLLFHERSTFLSILDRVTVLILITDYSLRLFTADYFFDKKSVWSFICYPFRVHSVISLLAILPSLTYLNNAFGVFRLFRLFKVFRAIKLALYSKSVTIILDVFKKEKRALISVASLMVLYIFITALLLFNMEPDIFSNFFEAVYWATITLTTVGYGDFYPTTTVGRIVAMASTVFGIAIIALPTVIFTASFMQQASQPTKAIRRKKQKKSRRLGKSCCK